MQSSFFVFLLFQFESKAGEIIVQVLTIGVATESRSHCITVILKIFSKNFVIEP